MKISQVTRPSHRRVVEQFGSDNTTGFLAEDLARIADAHDSDCWSKPMTADEMIAEMDAWDAEYDGSKTNSISAR